jgi:hypothetical protein
VSPVVFGGLLFVALFLVGYSRRIGEWLAGLNDRAIAKRRRRDAIDAQLREALRRQDEGTL